MASTPSIRLVGRDITVSGHLTVSDVEDLVSRLTGTPADECLSHDFVSREHSTTFGSVRAVTYATLNGDTAAQLRAVLAEGGVPA